MYNRNSLFEYICCCWEIFYFIEFEYRVCIDHHISIHSCTFCKKIFRGFTICSITYDFFIFSIRCFINNYCIWYTWFCPKISLYLSISLHRFSWNTYYWCSYNAWYWYCPLDKPPGEWDHEDTECELREHHLVAELILSKHRPECDEDEEDRVDEVDNIGYRHPEFVHGYSESK